MIHSIQNSRQSTTIHLDGLQIEPNVIGCLPGNRVVTIDDSGKRICIFSVDSPRTTVRTFAVKPVVDWDGGPQVIPSTSGDRLAWLVARTYSGKTGDLKESIWKKNADIFVMVSRLDGSDMRSLGSFLEFLVSDGFDLFGLLGWSEDGDYLFIYHDGGIWRVKVHR